MPGRGKRIYCTGRGGNHNTGASVQQFAGVGSDAWEPAPDRGVCMFPLGPREALIGGEAGIISRKNSSGEGKIQTQLEMERNN